MYFSGTWVEMGFAAISGLVGGLVMYLIVIASLMAFLNATCFGVQVMGMLYWFFYCTAFVVSIYDVMNNQVMMGVTQFTLAIFRLYSLAMGVVLGVWVLAFAWSIGPMVLGLDQVQ